MNELTDLVARLTRIGAPSLQQSLADRAGKALFDRLKTTLSAGEAPDGSAWLPTQEGQRAYRNAASKLGLTTFSDYISLSVTGPEAFAQRGTKSLPIRQMLPEAGGAIPKVVQESVAESLDYLLWPLL